MQDVHADESCSYLNSALTIFVVGASGDLAKKKTYPSLVDLFRISFLPEKTIICGYARSKKTDDEFRAHIAPFLKGGTDEKEDFLGRCIYRSGGYDNEDDVKSAFVCLRQYEKDSGLSVANRLFYFAIPPSVFVPIGKSLKNAVIGPSEGGGAEGEGIGWNRLIIEKPFGKDSDSFELLHRNMGALYSEDHLYRIDHYLGKSRCM